MCLAALSSRGTLVLEAALRSALLALERALAEQQRQQGACGLCAPCLFPPCANLTRYCPRESQTPGSHGPIPRRPCPNRAQRPHPNTAQVAYPNTAQGPYPNAAWGSYPNTTPCPGDPTQTQTRAWRPYPNIALGPYQSTTPFPRNPTKMTPQEPTQTVPLPYRLYPIGFTKTAPRLPKHIPNC